jgi:hypothetical protein
MRLKEIEARLAEIKEELNTRAAELTDEEITKLETEVTDLQEERTALLAAAEKRKKLLERIAAGEPTGGAGADTTLLEISREQAAQEQENQRTNTTLRHTEKRL